jgi:hypothetical protein
VEVSDAETSVEQESAGPSGEFTPAPGDAQPDAEGGGAAQ